MKKAIAINQKDIYKKALEIVKESHGTIDALEPKKANKSLENIGENPKNLNILKIATRFATAKFFTDSRIQEQVKNIANRDKIDLRLITPEYINEFIKYNFDTVRDIKLYKNQNKVVIDGSVNTDLKTFNLLSDIAYQIIQYKKLYDINKQEILNNLQIEDTKPAPKMEAMDEMDEEHEKVKQVYNRSILITFKVFDDLQKYLQKYKNQFDQIGYDVYSNNVSNLMNVIEFINSGIVARFKDRSALKDAKEISQELNNIVQQMTGVTSKVLESSPLKPDETLQHRESQDESASGTGKENQNISNETGEQQIQNNGEYSEDNVGAGENIERSESGVVSQEKLSPEETELQPRSENKILQELITTSVGSEQFYNAVKNVSNIIENRSDSNMIEELKNDKIADSLLHKLDIFIKGFFVSKKGAQVSAKRFIDRKNMVLNILDSFSDNLKKRLNGGGYNISEYFDNNYKKFIDTVSSLEENGQNYLNINAALNKRYQDIINPETTEKTSEEIIREIIRKELRKI